MCWPIAYKLLTMSKPRQLSLTALVFYVVIILMALWEAGWKFTALPAWFYVYAQAAAWVAVLGSRLRDLDSAERPDWQRVALLSFSWGVPMMAMLSEHELLASGPHSPIVFLVVWSLGSLVYGAIALAGARKSGKGGKAARVVRDWF